MTTIHNKIDIPITVKETFGITRTKDPVTIGIPVPKGLVRDAAALRLIDACNQNLALQVQPLTHWSDGTIRWCLLDFLAGCHAHAETVFRLCDTSPNPTVSFDPMVIDEDEDRWTIDTRSAVFRISKKRLSLFESVCVHGRELVAEKGGGPALTLPEGKAALSEIGSAKMQHSGPLRCTIKIVAKLFDRSKKTCCHLKLRYTFWAGHPTVKIECCLHNPQAALHPGGLWDLGDPGSLYFDDLSLNLELRDVLKRIAYQTAPATPPRTHGEDNLTLYQDSSGGDNWNSTNHVDRLGNSTVTFPGYRVFYSRGGETNTVEEGRRATPVIIAHTENHWIAATTHEFWQNFPNTLQVSPNRLRVGLFPAETAGGFELQGGEQKRHTIYFEFGGKERPSTLSHTQLPLNVCVDPRMIEASGAVAYYLPQASDPNDGYLQYVGQIIAGENSFFKKREIIDEFGWRNFGDVYADHEAVNHQGSGPLISHYNNQYDFIYGALVHFLRSGDHRWFELMDQAAHHFIDIDIYHTEKDKAAYNKGMFWHTDHYRDAGTCTHRGYTRQTLQKEGLKQYGGGPSNEQNYSSGLCYYYYLTGDLDARQTVLDLARWVVAMDDGTLTLWGLFDEGPTGAASATASTTYHHAGRGAANSINTLLDGYALTNSRKYLDKAHDLLTRCIHPHDDILRLDLDDPEHRWSYLVFLQVMGKFLSVKAEIGEKDYFYFYARDSLLHYARWMTVNEVPYKDVLEKVDIPTETWPAQDIRKCHIFHLAASYCPKTDRETYIERAEFFFNRCLGDLKEFSTAHLTRPLVLLCVYGYIHGYFQHRSGNSAAFEPHGHDFGRPGEFVPQKVRLRKHFIAKIKVAYGFGRHAVTAYCHLLIGWIRQVVKPSSH